VSDEIIIDNFLYLKTMSIFISIQVISFAHSAQERIVKVTKKAVFRTINEERKYDLLPPSIMIIIMVSLVSGYLYT
jgi:hypothetical protein